MRTMARAEDNGGNDEHNDASLVASYRFIWDDCFLIAHVNPGTGKQQLIIRKQNPDTQEIEYEDRITCIHTAVARMTPNQLRNTVDERDFTEAVLRIQTTEGLEEINLSAEEKFKAFRSWVAGIAEAGWDAFKIQSDIERVANIIYPIAHPLLKFIINIDTEPIYDYLDRIEHECKFEGVNHDASMISNLSLVLDAIVEDFIENPEFYDPILRRIVEMNPPIDLFMQKKFNIFILSPVLRDYEQFEQFLYCHDLDIIGFYMANLLDYYKDEIDGATYDSVEEAKRMGKIYHQSYIYKKDLYGIKVVQQRKLRQALFQLSKVIAKNRDIQKKMPIEFHLEEYDPYTGKIKVRIISDSLFFKYDDVMEHRVMNIIRKSLYNFAIGKIELIWDI